MIIIYSWNYQKIKSLGPVFQHQCPNCHSNEFWILSKVSIYFCLYDLPIFPHDTYNRYYCPVCKYGHELDKDVFVLYKQIAKINSAFVENKISEDERLMKSEPINNLIEVNNEKRRLKHIEESKRLKHIEESKRLKIIKESKNWVDKVSELKDWELIDILKNKKTEYNPAFIVAAEEEVEKRNLKF